MTLQQIYYALKVAEIGSMNKTAEKLFISQPTLTNAIRELESEAGIKIFERTSRGVLITNEGREFLSDIKKFYEQYEMLKEKYSEDTVHKKNSVFPRSTTLSRSKPLRIWCGSMIRLILILL